MRVRRVSIENFKRFESLEVELRNFDCLVGANNSGKTTLLQALALFDFCVHHCLERRNGEFKLRNRTVSPDEFYVLPVTNPMDIWHDRQAMRGNKQRRIRIQTEFEDGRTIAATIKLDFNRFGISVEEPTGKQSTLSDLAELRIAYLPVFSMFLPREERRLQAAIDDELARGRVHGVIRNLILELKEEGRAGELVEVLRRSFPALSELNIVFDEVTDRYITVTYHEEGRPKEFDIFSAGSGFQQLLYLFGFILLRRPTVVMLDEPDVHLHGSLQALLLDELRRLVDEGKQVLFATHSREMIVRVSPENILSLDGQGAVRLGVAYDVYDALQQLGSLEPTQLTVVQAYRRIVVTEDDADRRLLSIFCAKALGMDVWQRVEQRLAFCYAKGNPWKQQDLKKLQGMLQQVLGLKGQAVRVFVIADRDYHPDVARLEQELAGPNMEVHVWRRCEIENYLLEIKVIRRLLRDRHDTPTLLEPPLEEEFQRLLEASRANADDGLVQAYDELRRRERQPWDAATMNRMAREYLDAHWRAERLQLADAKDIVLPGLKRWLQEQGLPAFSDQGLAQSFTRDDLDPEIVDVAKRLAEFVGIHVP
jgi:ABC-type cobalamin/Fe3+-siderophores transport system ATPase subunit